MVNRYEGEIRINPIAILRNDDFNNPGEIPDIDVLLAETIVLYNRIGDRIVRLKAYLKSNKFAGNPEFNFADGGYISMKGFSDRELFEMKAKGLIELFDFATDRHWVKKYGAQFGLTWEDGRAVKM